VGAQLNARATVREQFRKDAGAFLDAHELILSGITACLDRFAGRRWPEGLGEDTVSKLTQVSQLSALFLQGIDPCEVAIAEGLYGQATALLRQHMEILGAIDEVWAGQRTPKLTPKISSLPEVLRSTTAASRRWPMPPRPSICIGSSQYNGGLALFLYRLELGLMAEFGLRQDDALKLAYGEGLSEEELKWVALGVAAANKAAEVLPDPKPE